MDFCSDAVQRHNAPRAFPHKADIKLTVKWQPTWLCTELKYGDKKERAVARKIIACSTPFTSKVFGT
jgi:hypothetical protein